MPAREFNIGIQGMARKFRVTSELRDRTDFYNLMVDERDEQPPYLSVAIVMDPQTIYYYANSPSHDYLREVIQIDQGRKLADTDWMPGQIDIDQTLRLGDLTLHRMVSDPLIGKKLILGFFRGISKGFLRPDDISVWLNNREVYRYLTSRGKLQG